MTTGPRTLGNRSLLAILFALVWLPLSEAREAAAEGLITIQSHSGPVYSFPVGIFMQNADGRTRHGAGL
jgi:hypothetical protein